MTSENPEQKAKNSGWIIKLYPIVLVLFSIMINSIFWQSPIVVELPTIEIIQILSISAALLVFNHSWIMTATELTRFRFNIFASPEEWKSSGKSKTSISEASQFEIDRHLNTHRNTTENLVYYLFLAMIFSFTSPEFLSASMWLLMFPLARLGYTYCYFRGKDNLRGIFMSLALLSIYGLVSYLIINLFR